MNRHLLTGALAALALAPAVATAPAAAAVPPPASSPLHLPPPTGTFAVGARADWVADPTRTDPETGRPRTLPIRVWYPARPRGGEARAPYFSPAVQAWAEDRLGTPG